MTKKILFLTVVLSFLLFFGGQVVLAQDSMLPVPVQSGGGSEGTESFPADPGVEGGNYLPSDPGIESTDYFQSELGIESTSWLARTWRNIKIFFTIKPIKKAELQLEQASTELIRAQEMIQNSGDSEKIQDRLEKINEKYVDLIDKINQRIVAIKAQDSEVEESSEVEKFLDKYTAQQLVHQELMNKLQEQVSAEVSDRIQEQRQEHLQKFSEVMVKLQNREQLKERLENYLGEDLEQTTRQVRKVQILEELEIVSEDIESSTPDESSDGEIIESTGVYPSDDSNSNETSAEIIPVSEIKDIILELQQENSPLWAETQKRKGQ